MTPETLQWSTFIAFVPLALVGSLLHFAFDWSRHNRVVAVFAAVNESYWEHIKIAFWPVLLWFVALFAAGGWAVPGFVPAAVVALYAIPVTMIALVFAYKRLLRRNVLWVDIAAFVLTMGVSLAVFVLFARELAASGATIALSLVFLVVIGVAFARYTITPPVEPDLFIDPTNLRYGVDAHPDATTGDDGR
ncbi:MAG TPA: DUF6512 family protein [Protaetiibacter sp.]|nr:DUF6512 family protein [Protaetiibacter sp.]